MGKSYISCYLHCVFGTKGRLRLITPEIEKKLWSYMCGIAKNHAMKVLAIGGTEDHIHMLISLPATISLANAMQTLKGISSKWVNDSLLCSNKFGWQEGYGAFSVGVRHINKVITYISIQKEHHKSQSFEEEFRIFIDAHGEKW